MDDPPPEPDPYAPPAAVARASSDAAAAIGETHALCELVRGWEKLRLLYFSLRIAPLASPCGHPHHQSPTGP